MEKHCSVRHATLEMKSAEVERGVHLKTAFLHAPARLEVGADAFARALLKLGELAAAGLDDGLDLLLGLLGDGNHAVQVLIHEETHKHLGDAGRERVGGVCVCVCVWWGGGYIYIYVYIYIYMSKNKD